MALQASVVSVAFGQGMDTKTDPKVTAKPVLLQDGIFTNPHRVGKRNGYDAMTKNIVGGGTLSNPQLVKSYRNELVLAATSSAGQRLFSYSSSLTAWSDVGKYNSIGVTKQEIASRVPNGANPFGGTINSSCAISGNIQLFSYYFSNQSQCYIAVIDSSTGAHLENDSNSLITGANSLPKSILIGASTLGMLYIDGSNNLILRIISVTGGGGIVVGLPITISSGSVLSYDARTTSTGAVISYGVSGTVTLKTISTVGAITHTASIGSAGLPNVISLNVDSGGKIWVYWNDVTTPGNETVNYAVYSSTLASVLAKTGIQTGLTGVTQIAPLSTSLTTQKVFYSEYPGVLSVTPLIDSADVNSTGTVSINGVYLNNVDIYSKIATLNSTNYMAVMYMSDLNPTGFIIDLTDGKPVAKFLPDQADGLLGSGTAQVDRAAGFAPDLIPISASKLFLCSEIVSNLVTLANTTITGPVETANFAIMSTVALTFDFANIDAYQAVIQQDSLVLNGGLVYHYDGSSVAELGFSTNPEITVATSGAGGVLPAGKWTYYATYEWTDANGNLHQSAPSLANLAVFAGGTTNKVTVSVRTLTMTQKTGVNVVFWRTENAGTIAYRWASVANDTTTQFVSAIDAVFTDATISNNETLYTEGGSVLDNIAPPPSLILWTNNNRIWCIDSENPETTIEYSKTASAGTGISFSTGLLELIVDSKGGDISGAKPLDEKTIIYKKTDIMFFIGDGANDSGTGATISNVQFVPSDVGCVNSKSVISFPGGLIFKTKKGLYLLNRAMQVAYFGADVEAYNSQDVVSTLIVDTLNQIRLLTSSGSSLLYDYAMGQWSVFTNHTGYSADTFGGLYTYVRTDGNIYIENRTTFLDNGSSYAPLVKFQCIKASSAQNFQRVRQIEVLGDYTNGASAGHGVQVSVAYDFSTTFSTPIPYIFGAAASSGKFQYREGLPRQKCDSIQILIQEITTGASGEYIDFTDLGMEIAAKRGLNKLPAAQSV